MSETEKNFGNLEAVKEPIFEVGGVLESVKFKEIRDGKGVLIGYKSSERGRKLIELKGGSEIEPDRPYRIKIVEDSNPGDPESGKLVGEVIYEGQDLTPDEWSEAEEGVGNAEIAQRKIRAIGEIDHDSISDMSRAGEYEILKKLGIEPLGELDAATVEADKVALEEEVDGLLGDEASPERALVNLRSRNLKTALRTDAALRGEEDRIFNYESDILKKLVEKQNAGKSVTSELAILEKVREHGEKISQAKEDLKGSTPEAWYGLNLKELKGYKKELESGKIVETEYVEKQARDVATHIRAGQPVFIHGHLGSGKTELAFHVAKEYFGKEALIISGSKHTSPSEFYGHQTLSLRDEDPVKLKEQRDLFTNTAEKEITAWKIANPKATENDIDRQFELIKSGLQERLAYEHRSGTESKYFMGQVYQAMEEGRPVILDEVNAIPHDVLISLNHLLTRRMGDKVRIQQNSGSEVIVKEGFGFILTGNINEGSAEQYISRENLDPAFLSRLYTMKHDYLPQAKEGTLAEAPEGDGEGHKNELFELIMARMIDRNGNMEIPSDGLAKLWNLAKAARATQDNFSRGAIDNTTFFKQGGGTKPFEYRLKEGVLSIRALDKILRSWQTDGYQHELDFYVFKEFVNQSTKIFDKAYLYQLFRDQFGFFQSTGWPDAPDYGSKGVVSKFNVSAPENKSEEIIFLGPRQVVDTLFGKGPERTKWPQYKKSVSETDEPASPESDMVEKLQKMEQYATIVMRRIDKLDIKVRATNTSDIDARLNTLKKVAALKMQGNNFASVVNEASKTGDIAAVEKAQKELEDGIKSLEDSFNEGIATLKQARDILGDRLFGPDELEKAGFVLEAKDVPTIQFSPEQLEMAKEKGLDLVLYTDWLPDGNPLTALSLTTLYDNKQSNGSSKLLNSFDASDWKMKEDFFTEENPGLKWKLVSKEAIPNSTNKNYLEQTLALYDYVQLLYKDPENMPNEVKEALKEFEELLNDSTKIAKFEAEVKSSDETTWKKAAETLANLKISGLFRESFIEAFYRMVVVEKASKERLLENMYSWTKSRSSGGDLVCAGRFGGDGAVVDGGRPGRSGSDIGCAFSAEKF